MGDFEMHDTSTESLILIAAKNVFIRNGYNGTTMQAIADEAGINKSLLHYYFRTKEKLFKVSFQAVFREFFPKVYEMMLSDNPIFAKIKFFVEAYIDMISMNPHIPAFVIQEVNRSPEGIKALMDDLNAEPQMALNKLSVQIRQEAAEGIIHVFDPKHFMTNMIGLCLFPVVAKPILSMMIFSNEEEKYHEFLKERKKHVVDFLINAIKI